jgi:uncharacterized protein (TIGR03086 family)
LEFRVSVDAAYLERSDARDGVRRPDDVPVRGRAAEEGRWAMELLDLHARGVEEFGWRVHAVGDRWSAPSACSEWDVRALVNHLVSEQLWAVPLMEGATVEQVGNRFDGEVLGDDPVSAWDAAIAAASVAFREPGALERVVNVSFGQIPAEEYLWQLTADLAVHAWDLARGIGVDDTVDDELCDAVLRALRPQLELFTASGLFAPALPVPDGADAQSTLLALSGRQR